MIPGLSLSFHNWLKSWKKPLKTRMKSQAVNCFNLESTRHASREVSQHIYISPSFWILSSRVGNIDAENNYIKVDISKAYDNFNRKKLFEFLEARVETEVDLQILNLIKNLYSDQKMSVGENHLRQAKGLNKEVCCPLLFLMHIWTHLFSRNPYLKVLLSKVNCWLLQMTYYWFLILKSKQSRLYIN